MHGTAAARKSPQDRESQPDLRPLAECPHCDSRFVQPVRWREHAPDRLWLQLRCPECRASMTGTFPPERVLALDESLREGRLALRDAYDAAVAESMESMLGSLAVALELDLIGADDFAPRPVLARQ